MTRSSRVSLRATRSRASTRARRLARTRARRRVPRNHSGVKTLRPTHVGTRAWRLVDARPPRRD